MDRLKLCSRCHKRPKLSHRSICRDCRNKESRAYWTPTKHRKYNKQKVARAIRNGLCVRCAKRKSYGKSVCTICRHEIEDERVKRLYGLSLNEVQKKRKAQKNKCKICKRKFVDTKGSGRAGRTGRTPCIDHDHKNKKVRDIICDSCNRGLSCFRDSPRLLRKAAKYIEKHKRRKK
jgi:recombination endonuclease VII